MKRIVVVTDCTDVAATEIRAALIREFGALGYDGGPLIEPIVGVTAMSVLNGAFLLRLLAEAYPHADTVLMAVVNPLPTARSQRARLVGLTSSGLAFTAENTGVLSWLIQDLGAASVAELSQVGLDGVDFVPFGGKHFYPRAAVRLARGDAPATLGVPFARPRLAGLDYHPGTVVHIDNFGVAKFLGSLPDAPEGSVIRVSVNGRHRVSARLVHSMKNLPDGTWAVYSGSSLGGIPELGRVRNVRGVHCLSLRVGDVLSLTASVDSTP